MSNVEKNGIIEFRVRKRRELIADSAGGGADGVSILPHDQIRARSIIAYVDSSTLMLDFTQSTVSGFSSPIHV